ncbi:hypothetical protein SNE40_022913 [Patella caerulea]|uniref:Integrin alpha-2 domain-containing protein n=1 Tax=Patella caerulea TaxID=87958 RepID=A0AAN8GBI0_PATCE
MALETVRGILCLVLVTKTLLCNGFNLDARFSVIKQGDVDAYFGYSVAMHQIIDENSGQVTEDLLLVGAPKAEVPEINVKRGGAIFKCPSGTTFENDCQRQAADPFNVQPSDVEEMEDQWLGVVLQSQGAGKKVLTCAHRYRRKENGIGVCYTLYQGLDYQAPWRPCMGRPDSHDHEQFGLCQSGLSSLLTEDDGLVIGAPGSTYWRGVVFRSNISEELGVDKNWYKSPIPVEVGSESNTQAPPVDKYAYLGYSVTSGIFDQTKERYYVSGAPRSLQTGEVIFFTKSSADGSLRYAENQKLKGTKNFAAFGYSLLSVDINNDKYDDLIVGAPFYHTKNVGGAIYIYLGGGSMINNLQTPTEILSRNMNDAECKLLQCEHARFGLSLTRLGDINIDGFQDFAVGAPYEGNGTVYIYHGNKEGKITNYAQRLTAEDLATPGLRSFGYSLSGGLDLDRNGYPDLLVGSFEVGQVALIRTRPIINLMKRVTLTPEMINLEDDPICPFDGEQRHCIQIQICLQFTAEPAESFQNRPKINYHIEAEKNRGVLINRLDLKNAVPDTNNRIIKHSMTLRRQGSDGTPSKEVCKKEIAYLKDNFADKLNPLEITIQYSLDDVPYTKPTPGDEPLDVNEFPILATDAIDKDSEAVTMTATVDFVKECGDDNKCDSNLQFNAKLGLPKDKDGNYVLSMGELSFIDLDISIINIGEAAYFTRLFITKPESLRYRRTEVKNTTTTPSNVKCAPSTENKTLIECEEIGNPLPQDQKVFFLIRLDAADLEASQEVLELKVWVNTTSSELTKESDSISMPFRVINRADIGVNGIAQPDDPIIYGRDIYGQDSIKIEDEIGPAINHTFVVTNYGPGTVTESMLYIEWPYELINTEEKYLLYMMQAPLVMSGNAECRYNPDIVNPLGIKENPRYIIRPRNNPLIVQQGVLPGGVLEYKEKPSEILEGGRSRRSADRVKRADNNVILGCKRDTAKCHTITCSLGELGPRDYVTVTIRARLWENTLLKDFRKVREVKIRSRAELVIDSALNVEQTDDTNDITYAVTIAIPDVKVAEPKGIEWWIILIAVLAGVLLLVLLILILWKCGFFKRKKPEDMQTYEVKFEKKKEFVEEYYD